MEPYRAGPAPILPGLGTLKAAAVATVLALLFGPCSVWPGFGPLWIRVPVGPVVESSAPSRG